MIDMDAIPATCSARLGQTSDQARMVVRVKSLAFYRSLSTLEGWERTRMTQKQKPAKPRAQRTATRYRVVRVDSFRWAIDDTSRPRILLALCFKAADARLICRALNRRQET